VIVVDTERLLSAWLRDQPEIVAIVEDRVYTDNPNRATFPFLKLTQIAGGPVFSRPLYLDEALIQLDAYGGPKVLARQLIDTARTVLAERFAGDHPGVGVVTGVNFGDLTYLPDDGYAPPKPRFIAMTSIYTHP
jgi:hypothetical protein